MGSDNPLPDDVDSVMRRAVRRWVVNGIIMRWLLIAHDVSFIVVNAGLFIWWVRANQYTEWWHWGNIVQSPVWITGVWAVLLFVHYLIYHYRYGKGYFQIQSRVEQEMARYERLDDDKTKRDTMTEDAASDVWLSHDGEFADRIDWAPSQQDRA